VPPITIRTLGIFRKVDELPPMKTTARMTILEKMKPRTVAITIGRIVGFGVGFRTA